MPMKEQSDSYVSKGDDSNDHMIEDIPADSAYQDDQGAAQWATSSKGADNREMTTTRSSRMAHMRVTVRVEIEQADGTASIVERTVNPRAFGDNPVFFGDVMGQASLVARTEVRDAVEAVYGKAPQPAAVTIRRNRAADNEQGQGRASR